MIRRRVVRVVSVRDGAGAGGVLIGVVRLGKAHDGLSQRKKKEWLQLLAWISRVD